MRFKVDFSTDTVQISSGTYSIESLRHFLVRYYPHLVQRFYLRTIQKQGTFIEVSMVMVGGVLVEQTTITKRKVEFQYDWMEIFNRCHKTVLPLHEFINLNP